MVIQQQGNSFRRGKRASWDLDDWEFAGDEEKDHFVFGSPPTITEVQEATADLRSALRLGVVRSPTPKLQSPRSPLSSVVEFEEESSGTTGIVGDEERERSASSSALVPSSQPDLMEPELAATDVVAQEGAAPSNAMLEAFHQFQHNPQIQGVVLSLATDKAVWEAVLANQKIQEFRHTFVNVEAAAPEDGGVNLERTRSRKSSNIFSRLFWSTKKAFLNFIKQFQDFMSSLFEMADKKVIGNEKGNVFERSLKACMMLAVVVLAIVVFKRSAVVRRG